LTVDRTISVHVATCSRPEMTMNFDVGSLRKCLSEVLWRSVVKITIRQNTQTKLDSLWNSV